MFLNAKDRDVGAMDAFGVKMNVIPIKMQMLQHPNTVCTAENR